MGHEELTLMLVYLYMNIICLSASTSTPSWDVSQVDSNKKVRWADQNDNNDLEVKLCCYSKLNNGQKRELKKTHKEQDSKGYNGGCKHHGECQHQRVPLLPFKLNLIP